VKPATPEERRDIAEMMEPILAGLAPGIVVVFNAAGFLTHSNDVNGEAARYMADCWRDSIYRETEPVPPV
jgi:hypothetical protein